ncbi:MAG: protein kinase [Planctomycetes bacterium]|nr:protein kinase [Planctomycetota bacterium]
MAGKRPEAGMRLGQYVLDRKLGAGGFAEVWRAVHAEIPGKVAAVKVPTSDEYVRQLRGEAALEHRLEHPRIVRTLDLDTRHEPPYFVMEYVEGESLRDRLRRAGKLSWREAARIGDQVLDALAYAHGQGVLHRDVKPENLLVAAAGAGEGKGTGVGDVKVTDFGLGRAHAGATLSVQKSLVELSGPVAAEVAGTWGYMSPEQAAGGEGDARSDLYAVGVTMYELARGAAKVLRFPMTDAPAAFSRVVERATEEDPVRRYADANEMRRALVAALEARPAEGEAGAGAGAAGAGAGAAAAHAQATPCTCGHVPAAEALFCERCGRNLGEWACVRCGKGNPAWVEKCWNCGRPQAAGRPGNVAGGDARGGRPAEAAAATPADSPTPRLAAPPKPPPACERCSAPLAAGAEDCALCGWASPGRGVSLDLPTGIPPLAYALLAGSLVLLFLGVRGSMLWQVPGAAAFAVAVWLAFRRGPAIGGTSGPRT